MARTKVHLCGAVLLAVALQAWPLASAHASCTSEGYIGSICYMAGNFCPRNHLVANGKEYPIAKYQALYSIIGNQYNASNTAQDKFQIPNLTGHALVGSGEFKPLAGVPRSITHAHGQKSDESIYEPRVTLGVENPAQGGGQARRLLAIDLPANVRLEARKVPVIAMTACIVAEGMYPDRDDN